MLWMDGAALSLRPTPTSPRAPNHPDGADAEEGKGGGFGHHIRLSLDRDRTDPRENWRREQFGYVLEEPQFAL